MFIQHDKPLLFVVVHLQVDPLVGYYGWVSFDEATAKKVLSEAMRESMSRKNLSISAVARKTGIGRSSLHEYLSEDRFPTPTNLHKLQDVLALDLPPGILVNTETRPELLAWLSSDEQRQLEPAADELRMLRSIRWPANVKLQPSFYTAALVAFRNSRMPDPFVEIEALRQEIAELRKQGSKF